MMASGQAPGSAIAEMLVCRRANSAASFFNLCDWESQASNLWIAGLVMSAEPQVDISRVSSLIPCVVCCPAEHTAFAFLVVAFVWQGQRYGLHASYHDELHSHSVQWLSSSILFRSVRLTHVMTLLSRTRKALHVT